MVVNVEFLDTEPIENVITSMHFKIDKTIFFGYEEVIKKMRDSATEFLTTRCGVSEVSFHALSHKNIGSIIDMMKRVVKKEIDEGNDVYFDITGGEELILVGFGMLSNELGLPVHLYDIEKDELLEIDVKNLGKISDSVERRDLLPTLDMMIEMHGCSINRNRDNALSNDKSSQFVADIEKVFEIEKNHRNTWNKFIRFMREHMNSGGSLTVRVSVSDINVALSSGVYAGSSLNQNKLQTLLSELSGAGIINDYICSDTEYYFRYKNDNLARFLKKEGNVLEYHTFIEEGKVSDECVSSVNIDWDGVIHDVLSEDVFNEVDVLSLRGKMLHFISCKAGKLEDEKARNTLYELDTVARNCGGKYAKKTLVTMFDLADTYKERAAEMGIVIEVIS